MSSVDRLKALGIGGVSPTLKYTKEELADYIIRNKHLLDNPGTNQAGGKEADSGLAAQIGKLTQAVVDMQNQQTANFTKFTESQKEIQDKIQTIKEENKQLKTSVNNLTGIVASQQRYLESLDSKERAKNLIVFGVPEAGDPGNLLRNVFSKLDCEDETEDFTFSRCGKTRNDGGNRPLLVSVKDGKSRNVVLSKSKDADMASIGEEFKDIRIKKDVSPGVRKEWKRLGAVFDEEKRKPENAEKNVEFDKQQRQVTVDGAIIDRFMPHF